MNKAILETFSQLNPIEWGLLGLFVFIFLLRFYYLVFFTGRTLFRSRKEVIANEVATQPISVIFTVRNEEENLLRILPQLLTIPNIKYEVVAVDDYSLDNTFLVIGAFKQKYSHFRISSLNEETRFSEKLAQNIALKAAKHDWILLFPVASEEAVRDWIVSFSANTGIKNRSVLLAYTGLKAKPGFFNLLCRLEMFAQQIKSAGFISNGIPFVYFEENVAFRKQAYFDLGGYGSKTKEPFANLELMINDFISKKQTAVLFSEQSRLTKDIETGKDDYYNLLRRSIRIESYLPRWKQFALVFESLTSLLYLPLLIVTFVCLFDFWIILSVLAGVKILVHLIIMKINQNRLNERKIFISSLVYDLLMPYFKMFYRWHFKQQSRKQKWKGKV